jgi:Protein of unknown function (DUF2971)
MNFEKRIIASSKPEAIDVPEVVHHYTSMETFLKIVQTKQLWATSVAYLNDTSEQDHFFKGALARVDAVLSNQPEWHKWNFSDTTPQEDVGPVSIATRPFLASFSSEDDSLPQWRAYCPKGNGVSLGFRTVNLNAATLHMGEAKDPFGIEHKLKCGRVEYDSSESIIDAEIESIFRDLNERFEKMPPKMDDPGKPGDMLRSYIRGRAVFHKHHSFRTEKEYRLVLPGTYWLSHVLHFVATKSTLRPYVKFDIPSLGTAQPNQSLHSKWNALATVKIGPTPDPILTANAVRTFLYSLRINCEVKTSDVPYRDW